MCTPARCRCLPTAKPFPPRCRHGTTRPLTPAASPRRRSPRFTHPYVLDVPPPTTRTAWSPLYQPLSVTSYFQTSPSPRQLVAVPRRIEFVILRTASSPPVAPHPASLRRSYLQLRGLGLPRHGLPPCCVGALAGALGADSVGELSGIHRGERSRLKPPTRRARPRPTDCRPPAIHRYNGIT